MINIFILLWITFELLLEVKASLSWLRKRHSYIFWALQAVMLWETWLWYEGSEKCSLEVITNYSATLWQQLLNIVCCCQNETEIGVDVRSFCAPMSFNYYCGLPLDANFTLCLFSHFRAALVGVLLSLKTVTKLLLVSRAKLQISALYNIYSRARMRLRG